MKMLFQSALAASWLAFAIGAHAEETALVTDSAVNVRGQPSFTGEVITQLKQGESVTVLEEISVAKPRPGEPARWAKIRLPSNTPVWINTMFIDPQAKTVKAPRLNLRAGPGENFSVIGRLERGDAVKSIRTEGDWMEVEAPPRAYAFMAAEFLTKQPGAPTASAPPQPATAAAPSPTAAPTPISAAAAPSTPSVPAPASLPVAEKKVQPEPVPAAAASPTPTPPPIPTLTATPTPAPVPSPASASVPPANTDTIPVPAPVTPALPAASAPPPSTAVDSTSAPTMARPSEEPPPPRRVVRREGKVKGTVSIQAPSYFELVGNESGRVINYLHLTQEMLDKLGVTLEGFKDYLGRDIVVSGEEGIDPRWPKTPVIHVETLKLVL